MERSILIVADITKDNGTLDKYDELMNKYRLQIRFMDYVCMYVCMIDSIPKVWKDLLKEYPVSKYSLDVEDGPAFRVDGKYMKLKHTNVKNCTGILLEPNLLNQYVKQNGMGKIIIPLLRKYGGNIHLLPYKACRCTVLQSF